jgi:hypothetical protein
MALLHEPRTWAYLVAVGPASIAAGLLFIAATIAGLPSAELAILWMALSAASLPAVLVGIWRDVPVVERETGVAQRAWVWNLFAVFLAPLVGALYLWARRGYFARSPRA